MSTRRLFSIRFLRLSFVALVVARGSLSIAAPPELEPLRVELAAPPACPAEPTLFARLRTHTSRVREARPGEASRLLHVTVGAHEGGFVADLRLVEERDELRRRVPGKTCEEVLAAVALIAALAIDSRPGDVGATPARPDAADASPDASARGPVPRWGVDAAPPDASGAGRAATPSTITASVGTSLEAQGLGTPVFGSALWGEITLPTRLSPSLRLRLARSRSFTVDDSFAVDPQSRPAFFRSSTAALEGCVALNEARPFQVRPCVQFAGGVLEAASSAFGPTQREVRPWASLGGLLQGRWFFLGPLFLEASLGLTVPLVRDDFFFRPRIVVYRAPPLVFFGNVGVGMTFP